MFKLNEPQQMIQDMLRQYMTNEVIPHIEELEDGKISSLELSRNLFNTLGIGMMVKLGVKNLPTICINGEPTFASIIPDQTTLVKAIEKAAILKIVKEH